MSFGRAKGRPRLAELSLTPLIDVVLNLLVFFMLSANFTRQAALQVDLPQADAPEVAPDPKDTTVTIAKDGRVVHLDVEVNADQLLARLRTHREHDPDGAVIVVAAQESAHRSFVKVMEVAKKAGFAEVMIGVEQKALAAEPAPDIAP
jgi:biopolymer transport protein ExbD